MPQAARTARRSDSPANSAIAIDSVESSEPARGRRPLLLDALDPSGCVVVALPGDDSAMAMARALQARGFSPQEIHRLPAADMSQWLRSLVLNAGRAPDIAAEIRDLRDFYIQALEGCGWLMVCALDSEREAQIREEAVRAGARSITRYGPASVSSH